jgi:signal transduction histidine kinase/ActR/RegA family two-component response regulator
MRLADFILANSEPILVEWEAFARAVWPGAAATDPATLRDDAEEMLRATALDMQSDQTGAQQSDKSKGKGGGGTESVRVNRASEAHGFGRVASGFGLAALIAEYRALRASVIRLWRESRPNPDPHDLDDLTRFNEAIDQSLTEAVLAHTRLVEQDRRTAQVAQQKQAQELRELNDALLVSSVRQHELIEDAQQAERLQRDLTETAEQAEAALRESEERYRMLFDLGPVAVYSCDASGVVQNFNRRAVELWGRAPAQGDTDQRFCGSFKMFRPDGTFMPHERCPMADVLSGALPFVHDGEVHIERPDGSRVVVIVSIRPLKNQHGEIAGAINCFYDISERKAAEEQLRNAKQEAEAASRAKDRFLAVLSHELRTPLTPVMLTVAARELDADLPLPVRTDLKMIRRNVELEVRLIDDLLDLSRITSGKLRLKFDALDVNDLVRHVCEMCRSHVREKRIDLRCDLDPRISTVVGDPGRLQQVFWNLLNNATKFTPEGGQIHVTTENADDRQVRVTVRDTGIGIAPDVLPRVFDAFEQGDVRITRQFGGMGLGLAISKLLVEQHRGSIHVESGGAHNGSTFVVELPALSGANKSSETPARATPDRDNGDVVPLRVLIVEDHADTATALRRLLAAVGHTVTTANTAAEALALAAERTFDVVVSDLGLPDMTGYELMTRIKQRCGLKGIAISGFGAEDDIKRSEQAGFSDHIVKPLSMAQLERSIRRVAGRRDPDRIETSGSPIAS